MSAAQATAAPRPSRARAWWSAIRPRTLGASLVPVAVGIPLIKPETAFSVSPAGRPVADHVEGPLPPVPARVTLYAEFSTPPGSDSVRRNSSGAMVSERLVVALA